MVLELIIAATVVVSFFSLLGIFLVGLGKEVEEKALLLLVSLSAGTLLGSAFFDLIPEALELLPATSTLPVVLAGILVFFLLEKVIIWHHHHHSHSGVREKPVGYLNLVGDAVHNFFDGIAIAAAFLASPAVGFATTIAVMLHEVPQELGDYSLLVYSGFTKKKALLFNLGSAVFAIIGALVFYFAAPFVTGLGGIGLAFAAGMFVYIAAADIVPELNRETSVKRSAAQFSLLLIGIALIWIVTSSSFFE